MWYKGGCWISNWPEAYKSSDIDEKYIDISMRNTLTAMSKTPEMSQVRLPCRQEGKTSAGNWA